MCGNCRVVNSIHQSNLLAVHNLVMLYRTTHIWSDAPRGESNMALILLYIEQRNTESRHEPVQRLVAPHPLPSCNARAKQSSVEPHFGKHKFKKLLFYLLSYCYCDPTISLILSTTITLCNNKKKIDDNCGDKVHHTQSTFAKPDRQDTASYSY